MILPQQINILKLKAINSTPFDTIKLSENCLVGYWQSAAMQISSRETPWQLKSMKSKSMKVANQSSGLQLALHTLESVNILCFRAWGHLFQPPEFQ